MAKKFFSLFPPVWVQVRIYLRATFFLPLHCFISHPGSVLNNFVLQNCKNNAFLSKLALFLQGKRSVSSAALNKPKNTQLHLSLRPKFLAEIDIFYLCVSLATISGKSFYFLKAALMKNSKLPFWQIFLTFFSFLHYWIFCILIVYQKLWYPMKMYYRKVGSKNYRNKAALITALKAAWADLSEELVRKICASATGRFKAVVQNKGYYVE